MQADSRQLYARSDLPDGLLASACGRCKVFKVVFECRRFSHRRCAFQSESWSYSWLHQRSVPSHHWIRGTRLKIITVKSYIFIHFIIKGTLALDRMGYTTASDDIHQELFFLGSKVILYSNTEIIQKPLVFPNLQQKLWKTLLHI